MKKIFCLVFVLTLLTAMSYAIPNALTGQLSDYSAFSVAINHSLGADTNGNDCFGVSDYQSEMYGYDDPSTLYVFIQGTFGFTNQIWLLIDSDANTGTGFSGQPPTGSYGESAALTLFNQIDNGGWDTMIAIEDSNNVEPPTDIKCVVVTYFSFSTTTVQSENYLGDSTNLAGQFPATINGSAGNLYFGYNGGGGAGQGLDLAIPRAWLGNYTGNANYRLAVLSGNNSNNLSEYYNSSFIPPLAAGAGCVGNGSGTVGNLTNLAGLVAPVYAYNVPNGVPVELSNFSAK